jgi:hypothetical protein
MVGEALNILKGRDMHKTTMALAAGLAMSLALCYSARADEDSSGLYAGASLGFSDVRSNGYANVDYYGFDEHHLGWKVFGGYRPIAPLGVELDYLDFGNASTGAHYSYDTATSDARAGALYAVGYLPVPLPLLDVFGKFGLARLYQNTDVSYPTACVPGHACAQYFGQFHQDIWTTAVAYGAGVQAKFANLAVRAEYERIGGNSGEPDLFSVGASYSF